MKKSTIFGLSVAIVFPLFCFFIVKYFSEKNLVLPKKYFYDSIEVNKEGGKISYDTIWHKVADFELQNHLGKKVSLKDYKDKIIVAHFFHTQADDSQDTLFQNLKFLQDAFKKNVPIVQLMSFTVNPKYDNRKVLKAYADKRAVNHSNWDFLTGDEGIIYALARNEIKIGIEKGKQEAEFFFSPYIFVLDKNKIVRGFYNGVDSADIRKLAEDVVFLSLEK